MDYKPNKSDSLRIEAESRLARFPPTETPPHSAEVILHQLHVLQTELEMQKEELRQALLAIEYSRNRYADLYDFAPVCYITLSKTGHIAEINPSGATLLGEDRKRLLHRRFSSYVVPEDQDQWHRCFVLALKHGGKMSCELRGRRRDGTVFNGDLDCRPIKTGDAVSALLITLVDITEKKQSEAARRQFETLLLKLTDREREVLALALSGASNKAISTHLQINQRTVENHRSRIHRKTGIVSLLGLAQQAAIAGVKLARIAPSSRAHDDERA
jgi:PAS domain S-box-containing protein